MSTVSRFNTTYRLLIRSLVIGILILSVFSLSTPSAGAASWSVSSSVGCRYGDSVLQWSGMYFWDWGKSWGWLCHWDGSSWGLRSSGYAENSGSNSSADAGTFAQYESGSWTETGAHQASFFSGTRNSYSNIINC